MKKCSLDIASLIRQVLPCKVVYHAKPGKKSAVPLMLLIAIWLGDGQTSRLLHIVPSPLRDRIGFTILSWIDRFNKVFKLNKYNMKLITHITTNLRFG
jgi:hypothetical protein